MQKILLALFISALVSLQAAPANKLLNPQFWEDGTGPQEPAREWKVEDVLPGFRFVQGGAQRVEKNGAQSLQLILSPEDVQNSMEAGACQSVPVDQKPGQTVKFGATLFREGVPYPSLGAGVFVYAHYKRIKRVKDVWYIGPPSGTPTSYGTSPYQQKLGFNFDVLEAPFDGRLIDYIDVCAVLGGGGTAWFQEISVQVFPRLPVASFAVLAEGYRSLDTNKNVFNGAPVTVIGVGSLLSSGDPMYLSKSQLQALVRNNGWSVASGGYRDVDSSVMTDDQFFEDLQKNFRLVVSLGLGSPRDFVFLGNFDSGKLATVQRLHRSMAIEWEGVNPSGAFAYDLRALPLSGISFQTFKRAADRAVAKKSGFVIAVRDIKLTCASNDINCTPLQLLEQAVGYVKSLQRANKIRVKKYGDLVTQLNQ